MNSEKNTKAKELFSFLGEEYFKSSKKVLCISEQKEELKQELSSLGAKTFFLDDEKFNEEDQKFDVVFLSKNILECDLPESIKRSESILKVGGVLFAQCNLTTECHEETDISHPIYDFLVHTDTLFCKGIFTHENNFLNRNCSLIFTKSKELTQLYEDFGNLNTLEVPEEYMTLWNEINLPIQTNKLNASMIYDKSLREKTLEQLSKRAFYLTRIAKAFDCKDIVEVGTAEGWQYYSFCKYINEEKPEGSAVTCDPRDVRNSKYKNMYSDDRFRFYNATSKELSENEGKKDFFYVDGLHDEGTVLRDVFNLETKQSDDKTPVWIFDDFDVRFGCFKDIANLCNASSNFKVYRVGMTASGNPAHQALVQSRYKIG